MGEPLPFIKLHKREQIWEGPGRVHVEIPLSITPDLVVSNQWVISDCVITEEKGEMKEWLWRRRKNPTLKGVDIFLLPWAPAEKLGNRPFRKLLCSIMPHEYGKGPRKNSYLWHTLTWKHIFCPLFLTYSDKEGPSFILFRQQPMHRFRTGDLSKKPPLGHRRDIRKATGFAGSDQKSICLAFCFQ